MSWLETAENQLAHNAVAIRAIGIAHKLISEALGKAAHDVDPFEILHFVKRLFDRVGEGFGGKVTVEEAERHIQQLVDQFAAQDAAIDAKIDAKFGGHHE